MLLPHILTHWSRVTHICVSNLTSIGSDNGLSPDRRQAIIWTNTGILLTGPLGTNFNEILIGIQTFSFNKMHLKVSSAKWRPFCHGFNVLTIYAVVIVTVQPKQCPYSIPHKVCSPRCCTLFVVMPLRHCLGVPCNYSANSLGTLELSQDRSTASDKLKIAPTEPGQ